MSRILARHRGSTGCHNGAKWCCVARRVAIDRFNNPSRGGNTKKHSTYRAQKSSQTKLDHLSFHNPPSNRPPLLLIRTLRLQISLKSVTNRAPTPSPLHPLAKSGPCQLTVLNGVKAPHLILSLQHSFPSSVQVRTIHAIKPSNLPRTSQSTAPLHARRTGLKRGFLLWSCMYEVVISAPDHGYS